MDVKAVGPDVDLSSATVVVGVMEDGEPFPGSEEVVADLAEEELELSGFKGKAGQVARVTLAGTLGAVVVGLGEEIDFASLRSASGNAVRAAKGSRVVSYLGLVPVEGATRAAVEGSLLGGYRFDRFKSETDGDNELPEEVQIVGADPDDLAEAAIGARFTNLARDWVRTPAGSQAPEIFAAEIAELAPDTVSVQVWDREEIEKEKLGGLLAVAAGSERDPRLVILDYMPDPGAPHLALVGKGVIFDSGGLSIKPAKSMETMKNDMGGAAAVIAATFAVAELGLPINVTTVAPLTDNTIDGNATRPGDVIVPVEGPTIEVNNTDAEGRLLLADALAVARRLDPDLLVDVATLTGGVVVALGQQIGAVFSPDDEISQRILTAASRAGEHLWELPLFEPYAKVFDSDIADTRNSAGTPKGSAITGALFVSRYAGDGPWAHLDIAGPVLSPETSGEQVKGPSGFAVRTLVELAREMAITT